MKRTVFYQLSFDDAYTLFDSGAVLEADWAQKIFQKKGIIFWEMEYQGLKVLTSKQKFEQFKRSADCACCETIGHIFQIVRNGNDPNISLELFGKNKYGDLSLMTNDHIIPKSGGGGSEICNIQTLCYPCNQLKADLHISISELRVRLQEKRHGK